MSFERFLHKNIFEPLGMNSTNLQPGAARAAGLGDRMATPYVWYKGGYIPLMYVDEPEAQGAGSIITSVNDYVSDQSPPHHSQTLSRGIDTVGEGTNEPRASNYERNLP